MAVGSGLAHCSHQRCGHLGPIPSLQAPGLPGLEEGNGATRLHCHVAPDCHINQPGLYDANKFAANIWFGAWGSKMI